MVPAPPITGGFPKVQPGAPGSPFDPNGNLRDPATPTVASMPTPMWQRWWHYNRDGLVDLDRLLSGLDTASPLEGAATMPARVAPLIAEALQTGGETQLLRGALLALGRLPEEVEAGSAMPLANTAAQFLRSGHPDSAEAAVLALGLGARTADLDTLLDLLRSSERGAELVDDVAVPSRLRAFAAYALALYAERADHESADTEREAIGRALLEVLVLDDHATYELHNALVVSLGLVPLPACDGTDSAEGPPIGSPDAHLCVGIQLGTLNSYFNDETHDASLRAHAAPALARLADGRLPEYKDQVAASLLEVLGPRSKAEDRMREGAAIGLGLLGDADADGLDRDIRSALERTAERDGSLLARRLAMISLAKVGARPGAGEKPGSAEEKVVSWLERRVTKDELGVDAWAVMALAVLSHDLAQNGREVPGDVTESLRAQLKRSKDADLSMSLCLALGLVRDREAGEVLRQRFVADESEDVRGAAALALGLIEERGATELLSKVLVDEQAGAGVLRQVAIALRLLGDSSATTELLARLEKCEDQDVKASIVSTLGVLSDPRSLDAVAGVLADEDNDDRTRGAAAFALAELADEHSGSWTRGLSTDIVYSMLGWTLESPFGDGSGVLDMRWW